MDLALRCSQSLPASAFWRLRVPALHCSQPAGSSSEASLVLVQQQIDRRISQVGVTTEGIFAEKAKGQARKSTDLKKDSLRTAASCNGTQPRPQGMLQAKAQPSAIVLLGTLLDLCGNCLTSHAAVVRVKA